MPIELSTPGWRVRPPAASRGGTPGRRDSADTLPGLPADFVPPGGIVADEAVIAPAPRVRGRGGPAPSVIALEYGVAPGEAAALVIRHPSGALTFHAATTTTDRGRRSGGRLRFQVRVRPASASRGVIDAAVKAIVVKVAHGAADRLVSRVLPKTIEMIERRCWTQHDLREGWHRVTRDTLASQTLESGAPASGARSLLFIHGTFSDAAAAFRHLAASPFFERIRATYGDRLFAFNHFSLSRTPRDNARMLLEGLPAAAVTFDVITHSRGGLVLRELVERPSQFDAALARRFTLGHAVLVASPNDGTPLGTPQRWDDTLGVIANLAEMLPDNGLTTAAALVSNGIAWLATHLAVDVPGLSAMDGNGDPIVTLQAAAGGLTAARYSALVANHHPEASLARRLTDAGIDRFFGSANDLVVPTEGGWRIGRGDRALIPGARIGCFGPGGNLDQDVITHCSFFSRPETVEFLIRALDGAAQPLRRIDPLKPLPDHRLLRGATGVPTVPGPRSGGRPVRTTVVPRVTVVNGDLTYVAEPLLLGHYRSSRLTGTERVMNDLLGDEMNTSLCAGLYPEQIGSHHIFLNSHPDYARGTLPRPAAVIVVGLGEEGRLKGPQLVQTVKQAALAWARSLHADAQRTATESPSRRHRPRAARTATCTLAATLVGSGGTQIGPGEAARLIVEGICGANAAMDDVAADWPRFAGLTLIELYLDRAAEAWRALHLQLEARDGRFTLTPTVVTESGGLARPVDAGYRGADYDFVSVQTSRDERGQAQIAYTLDTTRARSEVRAQRTQSRLLRHLIERASNDRDGGSDIRHTLFNLLVPIELEAYLAGTGQMVIELDPQTAAIPWELLDTRLDGDRDGMPWGVRVALLRKLKVQTFRERVTDPDADARALVIGEPECAPEFPRLAGAREEARAVASCLRAQLKEDAVELLSSEADGPGPSARSVLDALFRRPWRILHVSGHGVPPTRQSGGGVVLSDGTFLGAAEIASLRTTPELVFINCCYLASGDDRELLNTSGRGRFDRSRFAASVARALIDIGVRCVIAAGWAVDDDVARVFAETFYARLLENVPFIEAVGDARRAAWERTPSGNTWAAYQCYGDPDWRLYPGLGAGGRGPARRALGDSIATLPQLQLALDHIIVGMRNGGADPGGRRRRARHAEFLELERLCAEKWTDRTPGGVAEKFGAAAVEVGELERGIAWYEKAVGAADGQASLGAAEQLANLLARSAWEQVDAAVRERDDTARRAHDAPPGRAGRDARQAAAAAGRTLARVLRAGPAAIAASLALLRKLTAIQATVERLNLVGGSHKRAALIALVGRRRSSRRDVLKMKEAYDGARATALDTGGDVAYGALNCLLAELMASIERPGRQTLTRNLVEAVRAAAERADADFWTSVAAIELRQYQAVAGRRLASEADALTRQFAALYGRVSAPHRWASVYDSALLLLHSYEQAAERRRARATSAGTTGAREAAAARTMVAQLRSYARPAVDTAPAARKRQA